MAKALEDRGHSLAVTRPFQLRRYEAGNLPDPGQCPDAIIAVNDRADGVPHTRLALSNGASWDLFARTDEVKPTAALAVIPAQPQQDVTRLVQLAFADALPALQQQLKAAQIAPAQIGSDAGWQQGQKQLADAFLEMSDHVNRLLRENADLMASCDELKSRVEYLERHALARVETAA